MGITGLIYANCINMGIRIVTSLFFAFGLEHSPEKALRQFWRDLLSLDVGLITGMIKQKLQRRKVE
jgi:hypothetical protein